MTTPSSSLALGLGEADLKSQLGQPLRVQIKAFDLEKNIDDSCFKAAYEANGVQHRAGVKLAPHDGGAMLTISTSTVIGDPVINLAVSAECDTAVRRDFVLLLDPPSAESVVTEVPVLEKVTQSNEKIANNIESSAVSTAQQAEELPPPPKKKAKRKSTKSFQTGAGNKKQNKRTPTTLEDDPSAAAIEAKQLPESKPTLSISSGGSLAGGPIPVPVLRLDNQLQDRPIDNAVAPLSSTDILDEATALSHRLTNLEKQISKLQKRNAELEQEKTLRLQAEAAQKLSEEEASSWWSYLMIGAGVIGLLGLVEWWRRRKAQQQWLSAQDLWVEKPEDASEDTEDIFATDSDLSDITNVTVDHHDKAVGEDQLFDTNNTEMEATSPAEEIPTYALDATTEEQVEEAIADDIIDNAEVFIAHNRPQIAIQLLRNHLEENPAKSVVTWLFLLDLLKKEHLESDYQETVLNCKKHFNIKLPEFNSSGEVDSAKAGERASVEDYPHVVARLKQVWGTSEALPYLEDLVLNRRDELRVGFEKDVFEDILFLKDIASDLAKSAAINAAAIPASDNNPAFPTLSLDNSINWE